MRFNCAILAWAFVAPALGVTVYDLKTDYSDVNNPNGVWAYRHGNAVMSHLPQPGDSNALNPAAANGYWGVGSTFSVAPFMLRASQNGGATPPYTNNDFLQGDILLHGSNAAPELNVTWTAPTAGSFTYGGSLWYGHSPVNRIADFLLTLNNAPLEAGTITPAQNRPNAVNLLNGLVPQSVLAGDVLMLTVQRAAGQVNGTIVGVSLTLDFTPIPEPGALSVLLGLPLMLLRRRA